MSAVAVDAVARTMEALLECAQRPVLYRDAATGRELTVDRRIVASPAGLLPAFVVGGEAVWREVTGKGFALDIVGDPDALLGYRLREIGAGTFASVMLATMEAAAQVARPDAIVVNDLNALWSAAVSRVERAAAPSTRAASGARP